MFNNHARRYNQEIAYNDVDHNEWNMTLGFPQCCRLYFTINLSEHEKVRYLQCPMRFLSKEIQLLRSSDKLAYWVLSLIMVHGENLPFGSLN